MLLFSLCVASILDVRPDLEITRLWAEGPPPFDLAPRVQVLRRFSRQGDRVVAITAFSHELASRAGLRDVVPKAIAYTNGIFEQKQRADPNPFPVIRLDFEVGRVAPPVLVFTSRSTT